MVGEVQLHPDIEAFTDYTVTFTDGTEEHIDAVILATGYEYHYPFLPDTVLKMRENQVDLYKYVFPPEAGENSTLAIIGLVQAIGAVMPIAEMQARWATRVC